MAQILAQYNANVIITSRDLNNALVAVTKLNNSIKYIHYMSIKNIYHSKNLKIKRFLDQGMFLLRYVLLRKTI